MSTTYAFKMRGEHLMIAEETDGRKSWEECARVFRDEGKSVDSNRSRKGWSFKCLADGVSRGVYKSKGDAKQNAEAYCRSLLEAAELPAVEQPTTSDPKELDRVLSPNPTVISKNPPSPNKRYVAKIEPTEAPLSFATILRPAGSKKDERWVVRGISRSDNHSWSVIAACDESGGYDQRPLGAWEALVDGEWVRFDS